MIYTSIIIYHEYEVPGGGSTYMLGFGGCELRECASNEMILGIL